MIIVRSFQLRNSIQVKFLFSCTVVFIIMVTLSMGFLSLILGSSYHNLETHEAELHFERAKHGLLTELEQLHSRTWDWSKWDDAYNFVQSPNQEFISSNLAYSAPVGMNVDLILLTDLKGKVKASADATRNGHAPPPISTVIQELGLGKAAHKDKGHLVEIEGRLALASVRQITDSEQKKPAIGYLVMVRLVDSTMLSKLSKALRIGVHLGGESETNWLETKTKPVNDDFVQTIGTLPTLNPSRHFRLIVTAPRSVWAQAKASIENSIAAISFVGLGMIVTTYFLVRSLIISRITHMAEQVRLVDTQTGQGVILAEGDDEIRLLADAMREMLSKLADTNVELEQQHEELAAANAHLEVIVEERTSKLSHMNSVLQNALDGIITYDLDGEVVNWNHTAARLFGYETLAKKTLATLFTAESVRELHRAIAHLNYTSRTRLDVNALNSNGELRVAEMLLLAEHDSSGSLKLIHAFVKDVTERHRMEEEMAHQARHDDLTGLPNRRSFEELLNAELTSRGPRPAVLFIDLDDFKFINDSLGHGVGDEVLKAVAQALLNVIGDRGVVSRLGGDEFVALLREWVSEEEAQQMACNILHNLCEPMTVSGRDLFVSCSVGIALAAPDSTATSLMSDADTAMYQAKAMGKSGFATFDASMNTRVLERVQIEAGLRRALENGELFVVYQPLVSFKTGLVRGLEALIRWNHPELGMVSPVRFIPVAEETGLIVPIGEFVLREALRTIKELNDLLDAPLVMNINLSQRQLIRPDLVHEISDLITESGADPAWVTLEITESLAMHDPDRALAVLTEFQMLGLKIALDDFGTGYSSLSHLQVLPVNKVKIDRSFVISIGVEEERTAIVAAILALCEALGLETTAEGVETVDQVEILTKLGCDTAQGFYFARPMNHSALLGYLLNADASQEAA